MEDLREILSASDRIVFFGGAGVSTESGIPDFRSEQGIYRTSTHYGYPPEEIISHTFFMKNPEIFYDFYKSTMIYQKARPNKAHLALARLEQSGKLNAVITQNIDGLHQMAGSKVVYELHGTIHKNHCVDCSKFFGLDAIMEAKEIPRCDVCGGIIKPDVVLYEEGLDAQTINQSIRAIEAADVLIVGGTSLNVYPAAGFIQYFKGNRLVLINQSETPYDSRADLLIREPIGEVLGGL
jgi:NAD-dependent deacetylase